MKQTLSDKSKKEDLDEEDEDSYLDKQLFKIEQREQSKSFLENRGRFDQLERQN